MIARFWSNPDRRESDTDSAGFARSRCTYQSTGWRLTATGCMLGVLLPALVMSALHLAVMPGSAIAGEIRTVNGVVRILNSNEPVDGSVTLELEELWRAGGEDSDMLFGVIIRVLTGEDGNIYMLDMQLSEVHVFSPDGEFLRTLSREGEGPGEVRSPSDMLFTPDGRIGLVQTMPGRVVLVHPDDTPGGTLQIGGSDPTQGAFSVLVTGSSRGGNMVLGGISMSFRPPGVSEQTYFLSSVSVEGAELHRYVSKTHTLNFAELYMNEDEIDFVWERYALLDDGRVCVVPARDRYEIEVYNPDGSIDRVIERAYESRKRTADDKQEAKLLLKAIAANYPAPPRGYRVLDTDPDITMMQTHPDGSLWVRTSRGDYDAPAGLLATFDLFDTEGHYRRQVNLKGPGNPREDAVFLLDTDRVLVVTQALSSYRSMQGVAKDADDEADPAPMEAIYYMVKR